MTQINAEEVNKLLTKLMWVDRDYARSYSPVEYAEILQRLRKYRDILATQLRMSYNTAITATRDLEKANLYLKELQKDEEEAAKQLEEIEEVYAEKLAREQSLFKEVNNLKETQDILQYVKDNKIEKIKRVMSGKSNALNETTMDLLGESFGQLYSEINSKPDPKEMLDKLEAASQYHQQQKEQQEKENQEEEK